MTEWLRVSVPADLMDQLDGDGFDQVASYRGLAADAHAMLALVPAGLAVTANAVTILVSHAAIGDLIKAIRAWMKRHAEDDSSSEFIVNVSARHGAKHWEVRLEARGKGNGNLEISDTATLLAMVQSLFDTKPEGCDVNIPPAP